MIYINNLIKTPLYQQIYQQIKSEIIIGNLKAGDKLISTRELAKTLCVSRNTVERAYFQLCIEGYVISKVGSGFVVQTIDDNLFVESKGTSDTTANESHNENEIFNLEAVESEKYYKYNFEYGSLDSEGFPYSLWRRLTSEALNSEDIRDINNYSDKQGDISLRIEIMKHLRKSRGIRCSPNQIILCSGVQHAIDLICKLIPFEERKLAMEEPGYNGAKIVFNNNGFEIFPVPVGIDGIRLKELVNLNVKAVYITPSHQFPTGAIMPIQNRNELLNWATQNNVFIIEDDYDSEFRYNSRPIPSLQSINVNDRVIYLGTFSKALSPGLRMSYMVLPNSLIARYNDIFSGYYSTVSWLQQKVVSLYIERGHFERYIRKSCLLNKNKHDILVKTVNDVMGDKVNIYGNNAGLHILLEFLNGESQDWLIKRAKEYKVKVYPTYPYWINEDNCPKNIILLGFSSLSEKEIVEGVNILNKAWFKNINR
ncbi:GntR family transcriptional regulator [Gottschalkia acidurici 9a]|uniref:GntR family transcriptional regulator n=1 Tax=Gottschalkia acidurici (strain ATCC 7906 / DSM 604 / BCRC 14475 / CIP 104303 / KCTC 5404 / NCIMB 10678 / 9a) TaxID=1128398 RepID=K0AXG3_GOTA9|nr:PLP-dependent aminotransferase family protein [Gottschalkia acidurici]AFS77410.1 GntR family transcriptional regulator [Gottschalkia acidurici 9a]